jgi:predicted Zn-dependent protease
MDERARRLAEAVALREAGRAEEARPLLVALAAEWPLDAEVQYQAAWVHDLLGLEPEAVPYYERALALGIGEPDREGLVLGLGSTYRNVGRHADAVSLLSDGVRAYPGNAALRCFLALAQHSAGQPDVALATALSIVLDTCPEPSVERYRRALTWYRDDLLGVADPDG